MLCSMNYATIFRKKQIDTIPCSKVVANFKSFYKNKVTINSITKETLINRHNIFPVSTITCPLMIKWQQNGPLFFRTQRQRRWTSHLLGGVSTCVLCIKTFSCVETIKDQHLFLHSLRNTVQSTLMQIAILSNQTVSDITHVFPSVRPSIWVHQSHFRFLSRIT